MTALSLHEVGEGRVRAVFAGRSGGSSVGAYASLNLGIGTGDDDVRVRVNREAVAAGAGFDPTRAVVLTQVHGADVVHVGPAGGGGSFTSTLRGLADADASCTREPGVALLALGADCPVILAWSPGGAVSATHAGWRGLVSGVVQQAVGAMGSDPRDIRAVIGPCVGPCCYPVDAAMRETMAALFGDDVVRGDAVDLRLGVRRALTACGLDDARISDSGGCTCCDAARWFSYRRDGAATGRHAGIIWIEEGA